MNLPFYTWVKYELVYINPIRTSRGEMENHTAYYILIFDSKESYIRISEQRKEEIILAAKGIGEAAPLKGLSVDAFEGIENHLQYICESLNEGIPKEELDLYTWPSLKFALETAQLDFQSGGKRLIVDTPFYSGNQYIPINGLVWMNGLKEMEKEALQKIEKGFTTIKFKVGSHDFDAECRLLEHIRKIYNSWKITIRLDANGAFPDDDALYMLRELYKFDIHSIEQPIKPKHYDEIEKLCRESKIPIALDEDLIGIDVERDAEKIFKAIHPQFFILKPTLLGGLYTSDAWVKLARKLNIGWWVTSALESNIGLNAIAQWVSKYNPELPQGLGTGGLYQNNFDMRLYIKNGEMGREKLLL